MATKGIDKCQLIVYNNHRMNKLIETIEEYQKKYHLTDSRFSQLVSLDRSTLSRIKNGKRNPGVRVLRAISQIPELKDVSFIYLMGGNAPPKRHQRPPSQDLRGYLAKVIGMVLSKVGKRF